MLANVTLATITSKTRGLPTEVPVGRAHGLEHDSVVNCDNLFTVPKSGLGRRRGALDPEALERLRSALLIALDLG